MTRVALIVAGVIGVTTLAVHDAAALSARNRLCVQRARQDARTVLRNARIAATNQQRAAIVSCFGPDSSPSNDCAARCTTTQTGCLDDQVKEPRDLCDTSTAKDDGMTSCREAFDAAILVCKDKKKPNGDPDFDAQIACQVDARAARFLCTQRCAAQVQPAQDQCGVDFSDCLELCG